MTAKVFVDTNVLVYCRDATEPDKQARALAWMAALWEWRNGRLSFQVLQEFYVTVTQKLDPGLTRELARRDVRTLAAWNPVAMGVRVMEEAWRFQDRFRFSWWDALIVAATQAADCRYLLSEDFQDHLELGNIMVVNPFLSRPSELGQ
ncbi:MAG: PIN domain-containing protein [Desulfobaccales bacterium]|jgi:predicted nucleic acid-binding protein